MFHFGHAEAAKPNNAGAQQRSGLEIAQSGWQRKCKVSTCAGIFRVTAMHVITGKRGGITKIFKTLPAIPTSSIHATHPGDAYSGTAKKIGRARVYDFPDDLVSWDHILAAKRQFAFHDVQVCSTNAARSDAK